MSVPDNFHVSFGYAGTSYDLNLVKGKNEKSDYNININGITYSVLGDEDKLPTACKILSSISFAKDALVTEEDLKEKLSALEDITSPIVEKAGNLGLNTLRGSQIMSQISPPGPLENLGGADPISQFQTQKLQGIINSRYETVPTATPDATVPITVGCNLIIMKSGEKPVLLNAGNLPPNASQHWGSVSKQFTAACIAKLVDQKKINWTDDIRDYLHELPEFKWGSQPQKVTIDDLAHMSSGLPELGIWAAFSDQEDTIMLSMDQMQKLLVKCPDLLFKPGTEKMYCNDNYFLLAEIVARVAKNEHGEKKPFVDFVRDEIFKPLEMECRYSVDPDCPKIANGYNSDYKLDTLKGHAWGAFGVVGPPTDMAKWNEALESGEWNSLMSEPPNLTVPQGKSVYCRGLKVAYTDDYRVVYHTGSINGICARFMRYEHEDPSKTFAFFLATNLNNMDLVLSAAEEVADVLAGKDVRIEQDERSEMNPPVIPIEASLDVARPYEGEYVSPLWGGLRYRIDAEDKLGVPILHFSLIHEDGGSHEIVDLNPTQEKEKIVYRGGAGEWIERTTDGIVLKSLKMAPIIFKRKQ